MSIPHHLSTQLVDLKSDEEIKVILKDQDECLEIYKDTQQKLDAFNKFSKARYQQVHKHFEIHTKQLKQVKGDLDTVFLKLRKIKNQLALKYPNEFETVLQKYPPPQVEDD
ncbi:hypothetical protein MFLAVUS_003635 [Mucor flavus]|uniref:KxDL domain-containing protein n=1 Tax=Mucor flavus TaxID=439312 RepID=A0ABP9YTP5_9FUNG